MDKRYTFASLWQSLRKCYEHNERDISRAYGYFDCVNRLYAENDTSVKKVFITNSPIDRSEKRDALMKAATNDCTFYAVLILLPNERLRVNINDSNDWLNDSKIFRTCDEKLTIVRTLAGSYNRHDDNNDNNDDDDDHRIDNNNNDDHDLHRRNNIKNYIGINSNENEELCVQSNNIFDNNDDNNDSENEREDDDESSNNST